MQAPRRVRGSSCVFAADLASTRALVRRVAGLIWLGHGAICGDEGRAPEQFSRLCMRLNVNSVEAAALEVAAVWCARSRGTGDFVKT